MYSTNEEITLGRQYSFQIEKQLQIINDPFINEYINDAEAIHHGERKMVTSLNGF